MVGPDRPMTVMAGRTAGNRQGATEWPEHAAFCATEEREAALAALVADPATTPDALVAGFLAPPLYRDPATTVWGTVYTAAYDCDARTLDLCWPDDSWRLSLADFVPGTRTRPTSVAVPPPAYLPAPSADDLLPTRQALLIA